MSKRDEQIARMKGLMTYGISNTSKKTPVTESVEGADGKIYAIIREGAKFYIKSTQKGSELVTESFDYIGGFMNKKNNEFASYNQASKNLELKLRSINEAYGINKPVELLNPDKKEELMLEMTDSMKSSIARYRQIMNNTSGIMKESATISASNTGNPEAPKTTSFSAKLGEPFTNSAEATLDKDLKATASDPEKQGEPFGDDSKAEKYEDAKYVPSGSVANQKPTGGKVVRVNENEEFVETIEECDEWGSCGLPSSEGVGEVEETLDEDDSDEFVGFADEDDSLEESDDDIDLDDIDSDLDSDEVEDEELDDIDSDEIEDEELGDIDSDEVEDVDSDDVENNIEDENSEIQALKAEIDELRSMIKDLMGEEDEEDEYELELDSDDDLEDEISEPIHEAMQPSQTYKPSVDFPFEVKPAYVELKNKKMGYVYSLGVYLEQLVSKFNGTENDVKILNMIKSELRTILECDTELRMCLKNGYDDIESWNLITTTMVKSGGIINQLLRKFSFSNEIRQDENVQRISNSIGNKIDKYLDVLDELKGETVSDTDYDDDEESDNLDAVEQNDAEYYSEEGDDDSDIDFDELDDFYSSDNEIFDSVRPRRLNEEGTKLNVFGKHPGYRKKVMSLPQTGSDRMGDYKDWNDDSVYSEQPFGEKIGTSAPFDQVVNSVVNTVMESLKKKI